MAFKSGSILRQSINRRLRARIPSPIWLKAYCPLSHCIGCLRSTAVVLRRLVDEGFGNCSREENGCKGIVLQRPHATRIVALPKENSFTVGDPDQ